MAIKSIDFGVIRLRKMAQLCVMCPAAKLRFIGSVKSMESVVLAAMSMIREPFSFALSLYF